MQEAANAEGIWGVRTRELVAQALGCELGSLGWSRARYGASQSGRQQGWRAGSRCEGYLRSWGALLLLLRAAVRLREERQGRGHLTKTEGGRNGTMQEEQVWVWEGEVWWKATGRSLLKATPPWTHERARVGTGAVGLTRNPWTAPRPPRA